MPEPPISPEDLFEQKLSEANPDQLRDLLEELPAAATARAVSRMTEEAQSQLLTALAPEVAANLLDGLPDVQAVELVENLPIGAAAAIVHELPSDEQADLVQDLSADTATAILAELDPKEAAEVRALSEYASDSAGGVMVTEYLAYPEESSVTDVINDIRTNIHDYAQYDVQYAYVTASDNALTGVLPLRDLLLARPDEPIGRVMIRQPSRLRADDDLDRLRDFFDRHAYLAVPIVDERDHLLGIVRRSDVEEALAARTESDFLRTQGIIHEELRTMPLVVRSRRRLAWLSVNILLNIVAASVIALHQDTLSAVIALAVFLPIISDMSGCSGNQAVAVSLRELTLGLIQPVELWRVLFKEVSVGLINGIVLGTLLGAAAFLWKGNLMLGLVVATALALNTIVAVCIGGAIPLVLRRFGHDPALASGPVLTTITDMCGFFLVLTFAQATLPWLTL